jgi:pyruvate,water dikinase
MEAFFGQPLDVEWCLDPRGRLYILQARPLRVEPASGGVDTYPAATMIPNRILLCGGEKAASGVGIGRVVKVTLEDDLDRIPPRSVLVTASVSPECARIIDRLCAAVIDGGSIAGHFSSIAREFGVPTIVNAKTATGILTEGETVTVDANRCLVFEGSAEGLLVETCGNRDAFKESPLSRKLRAVLNYISPLHLTDPLSPDFAPEGCKSFHDIIRFAHERAMHEMFSIGRKGSKAQKGAKRLITNLPIILYLVDIGRGISEDASNRKGVHLKDIENPLLTAVWRGLSHRDIHWSPDLLHIDWAELERLSAGGILSVDSPLLASFAVISHDYLNLSIRFGYHFAVVDSFCGPVNEENYIMFNFEGGGSAYHGIMLRVKFLVRILESLGFKMTLRGDLVEAQLKHVSPESVEEKLEIIGCLLGCTRLMDYVLKDDHVVELLADQFLRGDYRFGHLQKRPAPGKE